MTWTPEQLELERAYRLYERLAILCGKEKPTAEQIDLAEKEADQAVEKLKGKQIER